MTNLDAGARLGLRERKKIAAMRSLEAAAFELFAQKGFDATTVEDIAERAELSRATFFRYFGAKEDVLSQDDDYRRALFMAGVRERAHLPVLTALRGSIHAYIVQLTPQSIESLAVYSAVMIGSRTLLGQAYEIRMRWLRELEPILAERLRDVPDATLVVPMLADITMSVLETSLRLANTHPDVDFEEVLDRGFALLRDPETPI